MIILYHYFRWPQAFLVKILHSLIALIESLFRACEGIFLCISRISDRCFRGRPTPSLLIYYHYCHELVLIQMWYSRLAFPKPAWMGCCINNIVTFIFMLHWNVEFLYNISILRHYICICYLLLHGSKQQSLFCLSVSVFWNSDRTQWEWIISVPSCVGLQLEISRTRAWNHLKSCSLTSQEIDVDCQVWTTWGCC